jgi:hypothetical protein
MCQYDCCIGRMYQNTIISDLTFSNGAIDDRVFVI